MTAQEIFDTVARHLLTQKAESFLEQKMGACAYRGGKGRKCAIGCLIPDEAYDPKMEGLAVDILIKNYPAAIPNARGNAQFLIDLQRIHDANLVDDWAHHLLRVACLYGLSGSVVHDFTKGAA